MPFNFSGVIRKAQWIAFRNWTLNERKAVAARVRAINSELNKIGRITLVFDEQTSTQRDSNGAEIQVKRVTEKRRGFIVTSGSSLEKLIQSYVAMGGNPAGISLYLQPDDVQFTSELDPIEDPNFNPNTSNTDLGNPDLPFDQPYGGVVAAKSTDSYGVGGQYQGGMPTFVRDPFSKIGRFIDLSDASSKIAIKMDYARRWVRQELKELGNMEARILKLVDLREQLLVERDSLVKQAIGGTVPDYAEIPSRDRYSLNLHLTRIVAEMDRTFFKTNADGEPEFDTVRLGDRAHPEGIANYDTLFEDSPDEDTYSG